MIDMATFLLFLRGFLMTLLLACGGLIIGLIGGFIGGFVTSRRLRVAYLAPCVTAYITIIRGTPLYLQVLLIYFALPEILFVNLSAGAAGIIALGLNSIAYVSEIVRGGMNSLRDDQWDAGYVVGYSIPQVMWYVIMPQLMIKILPSLTNELITLIKETSLLSMIGLMELTRVAMNMSARTLKPLTMYGISAVFYLLLVGLLTLASRQWERRLRYGKG